MGRLVRSGTATALAAAIAISVIAVPGDAARHRGCGKAGRAPAGLTKRKMRSSMLCLINRARERRGMARLRFNRALRRAATGHSRFMARFNSFSHTGRGGSTFVTRISRSGYLRGARSYRLAENIAAGSGRFGSPRRIFRLWMKSAPHRHNMLDRRLRDVGVGIARGNPFAGTGENAATYTLDLGVRRR